MTSSPHFLLLCPTSLAQTMQLYQSHMKVLLRSGFYGLVLLLLFNMHTVYSYGTFIMNS